MAKHNHHDIFTITITFINKAKVATVYDNF